MKRISIILTLIFILILTACSNKQDKVLEYVEKNQDIEEICSNVYVSCEFSARQNSVVLSLTAVDVENSDQNTKEFFDNMMQEINPKLLFNKMKKEESAIQSLIIEFCETDGDVVASYEYK